jgi:DNA repair exonuclease SbcCD ATPase subunit
MIRIENIEIEEFRGIKKLQIPLGRENFGICGPNGTGKSGVVDAIEFALTGDITRLGGSGSAELSVKEHAAHVDNRATPEKSAVKIVAFAPALNKTLTIKRSVKMATLPEIDPHDAKTEAVVAQIATHPEFALSRREIVKYIITPAGQRSKDVQALLRLDQIEKLRQSLQRVANDARKRRRI